MRFVLRCAVLLGLVGAQSVVGPGGMTPYSGGGGGGRRFGGYTTINNAVNGFFVAGSSITGLNGVYGPLIKTGPDLHSRLPPEIAQDVNLNIGAYEHDSSGWLLANVKMAGGATEWVFFDPGRAERFAHLGDTLIPGSGKRWWHLHRQSRVPPSAPDGTGASNSGAGPTSESTQMRAAGSADDDDELPWQVIGIRDDRRLEELRRRGRQHATDTEAAAQRRDLIGAPAPAPPARATAPPEEELESDELAAAAADAEAAAAKGNLAEAAKLYGEAAQRDCPAKLPNCRTPASPWQQAILNLRAAKAARRVRDFGAANTAVQRALGAFPLYLDAHWERGLALLDDANPKDALASLERLHKLAKEYPGLMRMLVLAHANLKRQEMAPRGTAPPPPPPPPHGCEIVQVGSHDGADGASTPWAKVVPTAVSSADVLCPARVNRSNWLQGHAYDDQFDVAMDGVAVQVARADLQSGWGMELSILCCNAAGRAALDGGGGVADAPAVDEATRTRVLGDNLYSVLLVPVDFTPGELKKTHRALSLRLHPDRAGGSTELFAKAAAAHDCLADEACRADFDAGTDVDSAASIKEQVERHYYAENYPFEPFGAVFENDDGDGARERGVRYRARQRQRAGWVEANASSVERAMPAPAGGDHSAKEEL